MRRSDLEHIIRASSAIAEDKEIVAVGSQAILGQHPNAPAELLRSVELDVFPRNHPDRSIVIDGAIGEQSVFHQTFGYYAHGVGPKTAILPTGWEQRLIVVQNENTGGAAGLCLETHDLAASKLAAGREKDLEFVSALLKHKLVGRMLLQERLATLNVDSQLQKALAARLENLINRVP